MKKSGDFKKIILINTIANYAALIVRFLTSIFLTRMLFLGLGEASYGFWILLWSIFGYSLLLDFGFGTSIQKYTAEMTVSKDFNVYNTVLSTVFITYVGMSVIIALVTLALQFWLTDVFQFPDGVDVEYYKSVFLVFGLGTALTFPTGAFTEVLRGLNKIYLRNIIQTTSILINFAGIWIIFSLGYGLLELAFFSIAVPLVSNLTMFVISAHLIPEMKIRLRFFNYKQLKEVTSFSFFAYLIMFANIIIFKTDQMVLGIMLSVEAVAIYQIGSRLADILVKFSTQFQDTLTPIAASLYHNKEYGRLKQILLNSNRLVGIFAFSLFIIMTFLARPILFVWLHVEDEIFLTIAYLMNISMFLLVLFRSGSTKVLLMAGKHKSLSYIAITESVSNVILSIIFIKLWGIVGVAIGTLVPNIIISVFIIFPMASRFGGISIWQYVKNIYAPLIVVSIMPVAFLLKLTHLYSFNEWNIYMLVGAASGAGLLFVIPSFFLVLTKENREKIIGMISKKKTTVL